MGSLSGTVNYPVFIPCYQLSYAYWRHRTVFYYWQLNYHWLLQRLGWQQYQTNLTAVTKTSGFSLLEQLAQSDYDKDLLTLTVAVAQEWSGQKPYYVIGQNSFRAMLGNLMPTVISQVAPSGLLSLPGNSTNTSTKSSNVFTTSAKLVNQVAAASADPVLAQLQSLVYTNDHPLYEIVEFDLGRLVIVKDLGQYPVEGIGYKRYLIQEHLAPSLSPNNDLFVQIDSNTGPMKVRRFSEANGKSKAAGYDQEYLSYQDILATMVATLQQLHESGQAVYQIGVDETDNPARTKTGYSVAVDKFYMMSNRIINSVVETPRYRPQLAGQLEDIAFQFEAARAGLKVYKLGDYTIGDIRDTNYGLSRFTQADWLPTVKIVDHYRASFGQSMILSDYLDLIQEFVLSGAVATSQGGHLSNQCGDDSTYRFPDLELVTDLVLGQDGRRNLVKLDDSSFETKAYLCPSLTTVAVTASSDATTVTRRSSRHQTELGQSTGWVDINPGLIEAKLTNKYTINTSLMFLLAELTANYSDYLQPLEITTLLADFNRPEATATDFASTKARFQHTVYLLWLYKNYPYDVYQHFPALLAKPHQVKELACLISPCNARFGAYAKALPDLITDYTTILEWLQQCASRKEVKARYAVKRYQV